MFDLKIGLYTPKYPYGQVLKSVESEFCTKNVKQYFWNWQLFNPITGLHLDFNRFPFDLDMLSKVPFSNETYNIESGNIEKGKVTVQVFEVSTTFGTFLNGLEATNKGIDLNKFIKVGSMSDASINGNWGE